MKGRVCWWFLLACGLFASAVAFGLRRLQVTWRSLAESGGYFGWERRGERRGRGSGGQRVLAESARESELYEQCQGAAGELLLGCCKDLQECRVGNSIIGSLYN